jgi:hypothetical protein
LNTGGEGEEEVNNGGLAHNIKHTRVGLQPWVGPGPASQTRPNRRRRSAKRPKLQRENQRRLVITSFSNPAPAHLYLYVHKWEKSENGLAQTHSRRSSYTHTYSQASPESNLGIRIQPTELFPSQGPTRIGLAEGEVGASQPGTRTTYWTLERSRGNSYTTLQNANPCWYGKYPGDPLINITSQYISAPACVSQPAQSQAPNQARRENGILSYILFLLDIQEPLVPPVQHC